MILKLLDKYNLNGSFTFSLGESLHKVCTAPNDHCGVYLVFEILNTPKKLLYIGSSGHITNDGLIHIRKTGGGGLKGRIVNGHQFNKEKRFICWPKKMVEENIEVLEIHWYVTFISGFTDSPSYVEYSLLQHYFNTEKVLPRWNKKF